ncbi:hypothetical protein IV203_022284 [Nitzschia inconspicua]|uniref:Uncharacterized protein n=1 Tax=Nitzschia inconspicua TaxID=303405 RepID=A0A9K3PEW8_9STRA|nr:hypothetical protein IV203_022284 [Nitzschia inconspicua]
MVLPLIVSLCIPCYCNAWVTKTNILQQPLTTASHRQIHLLTLSHDLPQKRFRIQHFVSTQPDQEDDIVDVEFEPVVPSRSSSDQKRKKRQTDSDLFDADSLSEAIFGESKTLIDLSFETAENEAYQNLRIPFCQGEEYIDGRLAFMVDFEGQSYGIAVPYDDAVVLISQETGEEETKSGKYQTVTHTSNIPPEMYGTNEEYAELMEIFAKQVQEQLGEEFQLRKTPKVLTISGGLDKITKDWEKTVVSDPVPIEDLLEVIESKSQTQVDKELDDFFQFMRQELGDEEFENTMNGDDELSDEDKELLKYFDVPKIRMDDPESLDELFKSFSNDLKQNEVSGANKFKPKLENAALKILGYTFKDSGQSYFLVKPFQPVTLVGRHMKDEKDSIRFQLLTPEEEKVLIPKLEKICEAELKAKGLTFPKSDGDSESMSP